MTDDKPPQDPYDEEQDDDDFDEDAASKASGSNRASDSDSEDDEQVNHNDHIDNDELQAMKREREEMIQQAGGEDRLGKRRRTQAPSSKAEATTSAQDPMESAQADTLWQQIKEQATSSNAAPAQQEEEMVKVVQIYKFAGKVETTEKLLPASHPEAIAHLKAQSTAASAPKAAPKPGPRRKKGSSLASLSAAATAKPTKVNTLEKSKMDWESYKGQTLGEDEKAEIEAQTKGGGSGLGTMKGYLDRKDFLERVERRLEGGPKGN